MSQQRASSPGFCAVASALPLAGRSRAPWWGKALAGPVVGARLSEGPLPSPLLRQERRRRSIQALRGARPVADRGHAHLPPLPRRRSCSLARGGERGAASGARCGGEAGGGSSRDTEHTRPTRRRGGVEAAGRGGAGKRAVRQRDPTWALRCPAFPSLKYYSVRREREPRSPASPRRRFHATSNALSPPPRFVRVSRGVGGRGRGVVGYSSLAGARLTRIITGSNPSGMNARLDVLYGVATQDRRRDRCFATWCSRV